LLHRGPDDQGLEQGSGFDLGFNRLSILDLTNNGHQPMWSGNKRYCLVFNGEIYNYKEIKKSYLPELNWQGSSDTEVLLQLLIEKGEDAIPLLNGMFAFCWIDTHTGEYIMGRDRFGIKPLYYTFWQNNLYFASELKGLKAICPRTYDVSETALLDYLGSGYITGPLSIYKDVFKFPPAHFTKGNLQDVKSLNAKSYWELVITEDYSGTYEQAIEELDDLLTDAVRLRLRSDVPLGIFLSGGIDSGLVAAMAAQEQEVNCYTISFPGASNDESVLARKTADHIGAKWHSIEMKGLDSVDVDKLAHFYDEPFSDSSAIPSYAICQAASRKATVFLTGDAGDEAFAGYKRYIKSIKYKAVISVFNPLSHLPGLRSLTTFRHFSKLDRLQAPRLFRSAYPDDLPNSWYYEHLMPPKVYQKFLSHHRGKAINFYRYTNLTSNQQHFDYLNYLPDDILVKMDRASMANSIEVRSPFLDYRLHELAASLPRNWLIDNKGGKKILRDLAKRYLPQEVVHAKKAGFGVPLHDWTREVGLISKNLKTALAGLNGCQLFSEKSLELLLEWHQQGKINLGPMIWKIFILGKWTINRK